MPKLWIYFVKRILLYILIFFLSLTVFFWVLNSGPNDPVIRYMTLMQSRYGYDTGITAAGVQEFREAFGLDKPILYRYLAFMRELIFHGNFGPSITAYPTPAQNIIRQALPWSIGLLAVAYTLSAFLGIILGTILGWNRGKLLDSAMAPLALVLSQVPTYLMALLLAVGLVYGVGLFPAGGAYLASQTREFSLRFIGSVIYHAILPALSMILVYLFAWSLSQRALVINLIGEDYMRLAEAKGLPTSRLLNRYVLRNTLLPQATGLALGLGSAVNGQFLIEWIFRYPGMGRLFVTSMVSLDFNVLLGIAVTSMITVLVASLIIEFLYPLIDPRIRRA